MHVHVPKQPFQQGLLLHGEIEQTSIQWVLVLHELCLCQLRERKRREEGEKRIRKEDKGGRGVGGEEEGGKRKDKRKGYREKEKEGGKEMWREGE